jgi:hypothetical protein
MMSHHAHRTSHVKTDLSSIHNNAKTARTEGIFAQNIKARNIFMISKVVIFFLLFPKHNSLFLIFCNEYGRIIIVIWHVLLIKY